MMRFLRNKVLRFIQERSLFRQGETVVVAFSGGADSMALLDILANLPGFPLKLVAVHLNHMLRGEDSDGDEQFVRSTARSYGIHLETSSLDVAALARDRRLALEEAGREARYRFFREIALQHSASAVALGHHKDDQAETVLMRLLRGAGGSGLSGMRPASAGIVRPLLQLSRVEIEDYLRKGGLAWREDKSNSDKRFLRNRIRHELLPILEAFNPEMVQALSHTAEALATDEDILKGLTSESFNRAAVFGESCVRFDLEKLFMEPVLLRKRLYRTAVSSVKGDLKRISFVHLADIEALTLSSRPNGFLNLPCGVRIVKEYGNLLFTGQDDEPSFVGKEFSIDGCGSYELTCGGLFSVIQTGNNEVKGRGIIHIDPEELPFPWTVRYFRSGDRFRPLGMGGSKKLKDLFIDRKIPPRERAMTPLLVCRDEIVWVCGVQPSERTRVAAGGREQQLLRITYTPASIRH